MKQNNSIQQLQRLGQSVWIDYTRRDLIANGELRRMIDEDFVTGMTSNPSIFEKAIAGSVHYDDDIRDMAFQGRTPVAIYEALSRTDIQQAADEFQSVYQKTHGNDGFVSLEVNPHLANDTRGTILEARRLWREVRRPNTLIKVPATPEGVPAIKQLISDGINVNITLLFGLRRYEEVINAYIAGIGERVEQGKEVESLVSVASFFLSRIDAMIDPLLDRIIQKGGRESAIARPMRGTAAVASAAAAYALQKKMFSSSVFKVLTANGARSQKLLWASTSAKDPLFDELKYVESLAGPNTITTLTPKTLAAYKARGKRAEAFDAEDATYRALDRRLCQLGINLDDIAETLESEGVAKFTAAFDKLIAEIQKKSKLNQAVTFEEKKGNVYDTQH